MNIEKIITELTHSHGKFPREAVDAAIEQYEDLKPILLDELANLVDDIESIKQLPDDYMLHIFAMFILADFREPAAYPLFIRFVSLPSETVHDALGDVVTESLPMLLASVSHGDILPIKSLIENPAINEYVRCSALESLLILYVEGDLPRDQIIDYLRELYISKLEREYSFIWTALVNLSADLHPLALMAEIEQAYQDDLVEPLMIDFESVQEYSNKEQQEVLQDLNRDHYRYANNSVYDLENWACYREAPKLIQPPSPISLPTAPSVAAVEPNFVSVRTEPKVARNAPCPCGSGKKYKKCCLK